MILHDRDRYHDQSNVHTQIYTVNIDSIMKECREKSKVEKGTIRV